MNGLVDSQSGSSVASRNGSLGHSLLLGRSQVEGVRVDYGRGEVPRIAGIFSLDELPQGNHQGKQNDDTWSHCSVSIKIIIESISIEFS